MTDPIRDIHLSDIDPDAIPRDRIVHDPEALAELRLSIETEGLRHPIEIFETEPDPDRPCPYGLISGHRRLSVFREMGRDTIPAVIRQPDSLESAIASMVSENEMRAQVSPWEKAMLIVTCLRAGLFPTADAAVEHLFPALSRQKRSRLRGHVIVADEFEYRFATPERLSVSRLDRLASALRSGWDDILHDAIPDRRTHALDSQWEAVLPVLTEALSPTPIQPAPSEPGAPRRMRTLRRGLTVRRELTRKGWILRFSGPEAKSPGIIDDVLDEVERWFRVE
ncbi:ParB/RepB/Spo0J family partition protein [Marinibacterium profundimaris]|uniref:ParB/RepB/Spo0J family partition protein n=1 Tax=Marinibacterium profundimaris TaxID=1679460 RepID=UPI000B524EB1|nr:ParB N-terminal domain-containing protein [Marinibacterium profundimaris]